MSLANLPQLAVDILITSLGLTRVGIIGNGETVVPFFGPGEGSELVTGGLEGQLSSSEVEIRADYQSMEMRRRRFMSYSNDHRLSRSAAWTLVLDKLTRVDQKGRACRPGEAIHLN